MRHVALAVIALALLCCCSSSKEMAVMAIVPAAATPPAAAERPAMPDTFTASGPLVVENQIDVAAQRQGVIISIFVEPGTRVHKGKMMAKMDDRQISADLAAASAKVRSLEANLENWHAETKVLMADRRRAEKLYDAKVISKEQLDHAVYAEEADEYEIKRESESLNNARDVEHSLELEKEKTNIVAPFDGVVARRYVRAGQAVAVGDRLFWVSATGPLQVKFTLPERFFGDVKRGSQVLVNSADGPGSATYSAKVVQVSPVIDPSSGTIEVLADVTGSGPELRPGMLVNIKLKRRP